MRAIEQCDTTKKTEPKKKKRRKKKSQSRKDGENEAAAKETKPTDSKSNSIAPFAYSNLRVADLKPILLSGSLDTHNIESLGIFNEEKFDDDDGEQDVEYNTLLNSLRRQRVSNLQSL